MLIILLSKSIFIYLLISNLIVIFIKYLPIFTFYIVYMEKEVI
ncbi:hypothetical protein [Salmonella phage SD-2_S15]|nr:hypothetical protein [Salmonella phage SD-2_S15]